MTLIEAIAKLDELNDDFVFFVRQPWSSASEVSIDLLDEELRVPNHIAAAGLAYFLEIRTAREVLEVFDGTPPTLDEKVRLLLDYAKHDAFPQWVYER